MKISDLAREAFDLLAEEYGHGGAADILRDEFGVKDDLATALQEDFQARKWN